MSVLADADAGLAHLHYGYPDYIAQQATPFNATDEWLAGWAALKRVYQIAANPASTPSCQFTGIADFTLEKEAVLRRGNEYYYRLIEDVTIGKNGDGIGKLTAILPDIIDAPTGGGINGNAYSDTALTLDISNCRTLLPEGQILKRKRVYALACCWRVSNPSARRQQ